MTQKYIVAEITKSWDNNPETVDLISQQFEAVINFNSQRGYKLLNWQVNSFIHDEILTETIVAIFEISEHSTTLRLVEDFVSVLVTDCCGIGPITKENYCPNCGKFIKKAP